MLDTKVNVKIPRFIRTETGVPQNVEIQEVVSSTPRSHVIRAKALISDEADNCFRCGLPLDNEVSRMVGYGPDCCVHLGIPRPTQADGEAWVANATRILSELEWTFRIPKSSLERQGVVLDDATGMVATKSVNRTARVENGMVVVAFDYDAQLVSEVKELRNRKYDRVNKTWTVAPQAALKTLLDDNDFEYGDDVADILNQTPQVPQVETPKRTVTNNGNEFEVRFPYDAIIKDAIKGIRGSRFQPVDGDKHWTVPGNQSGALARIIERFDFTVVGQELATENIEAQREREQRMFALSSATDTDFRVEGVEGLRNFQHVAVEYITEAKKVIVGDTMGLGKTVESLAALEHNNLYPAVVIAPANLKLNWKKEVAKWIPHRTVEVLNGKNGNHDADITIVNYDILAEGWDVRNPKNKKEVATAKKQGKFIPTDHTVQIAARGMKAVIMDEGHYVKEKDAQRSRAVYYLNKGVASGRAAASIATGATVEYRIWMSGTPILNRPKELIFPLMVLDRFEEMGGFNHFTYRYCDRKDTRFGMDINGSSNEVELNNLMRQSFYIRRTKEDVLDELPPKDFSNQYVGIDNRPEYHKAEQDLIEYVGERARSNPDFLAQIEALSDDEQELAQQAEELRARGRAEAAEVLVRMGNLRRLTAEGKLQSSIDWIEEFLKSGESLIVFANHRRVVQAISERFNAPKIMGGMNVNVVERGKEAFQAGEEQMIVLNIKAGGVGHTLTAASNVVFVEYPYTPGEMDQAIDRAYARMNDLHGVMVWQLVAEDTMDEVIMDMLAEKRQVVNAVTEGVERNAGTNMIQSFMNRRAA